MSRSVNQVLLLGRIGRDSETKFTQGGVACTKFSVATSQRYKDQSGEYKEITEWTNVVAWRQEKVADYLKKGTQVFVRGRLQTRSYEKNGEKKYSTEVVAEEIILLGSGKQETESAGVTDDGFDPFF